MGLVGRQLGCQQNDLGGLCPHVWQLGSVDQADGVTGLIWLLHMGGLQVREERTNPSTLCFTSFACLTFASTPLARANQMAQMQGVEQQAVSHC